MNMGQKTGTAAVRRLFLVENMAMAERAARQALAGSRYRIVAVARSVSVVQARLQEALEFDIALVDLRLDESSSGIDAIACMRQARPAAPIICMSQLYDSVNVQAALQAGAIGFIAKSDTFSLVGALDDALRVLSPLSPRAARSLVAHVQASPAPSPALATLSKQEQQVLQLLGKVRTYQEVSGQMGLSLGTIQTYIKRLYRKLGVRTKAQATQIALQQRPPSGP